MQQNQMQSPYHGYQQSTQQQQIQPSSAFAPIQDSGQAFLQRQV